VLSGEGKRMHLFHQITRSDGAVVATVESMLIHVNLGTRRSCLPESPVAAALAAYGAVHAPLPRPAGAVL
jgi:carnitine 3-dehydrogenase